MYSNKEYYDFAMKWSALFKENGSNIQTMAKAYLKAYRQIHPDGIDEILMEETQKIVKIDDLDSLEHALMESDAADVLYDAVQIRCEFIEQQNDSFDAENTQPQTQWLSMVLARIARLCSNNLFPFQGDPRSMRLTSQRECFHDQPYPWEDVWQEITLDGNGRLVLSAKTADDYQRRKFNEPKRALEISPVAAQHILNRISGFFSVAHEELENVFDAGIWNLELTNTEGQVYCFEGALYGESEDDISKLSDFLRVKLGIKQLLAFDDRWTPDNAICRFTLKYKQCVKDADGKTKNSGYELLTIDRKTGTIQWTNKRYVYGEFEHRYYFPQMVNNLLDRFSDPRLFRQITSPTNELEDAYGGLCTTYTLNVDYENGVRQTLSGNYDKAELPEYFSNLMAAIKNQMHLVERGGMLDFAEYGRAEPRKGQVIYCSVAFEDNSKTYYYRTEDESLCEGDYVVVPAGFHNRETVARVVKIENFAQKDVPFPIEKTKWILCRYTEEEPE